MQPYTKSLLLQTAAGATGAGTIMDVAGMTTVAIGLTISASATVTFEARIGGGTMTAIAATNQASGAVATTATVTGNYIINIAGMTHFQARVSTFGSGTIDAFAFALADSGGSMSGSVLTGASAAAAGASIVSSSAAETGHVLKASAGTLISLVGYNGRTSAQFVQVHNTTTVPADAAVPIYSFTVPASSNFSLDIPVTGAPFTTGIAVCNSSTQATKTVGSADCWFTAVVK